MGKIPWIKEWLPILVLFPGEFQGQRRLTGYSPWGCKESDMTEQLTHTHTHTHTHVCINYKRYLRDFPGDPGVKASPFNSGVQVQSLFRELRSYMTHSQKNKKIKHKQYCNKFNKDFKNGHFKKIIFKHFFPQGKNAMSNQNFLLVIHFADSVPFGNIAPFSSFSPYNASLGHCKTFLKHRSCHSPT